MGWYDKIDNYDHKVFIAGNHDFGFQEDNEKLRGLLTGYKNIDYLQIDQSNIFYPSFLISCYFRIKMQQLTKNEQTEIM